MLLSEPSKWGQRLTRMDFDLVRRHGRWAVTTKSAVTLNTNTVEADPQRRSAAPRSSRRVTFDISRLVGARITRLRIAGADVDPAARFVVAVNNYRRSGGGNFPGIVKTQVYNAQQEIRQPLIDWAQAKGAIDPADFCTRNWQLVRDGVPVEF